MAGRESTSSLGTAAAVAAGAGAAQLGLGYGLGVMVWPDTLGTDDSVWLGSLSWATWTAASSTVFGAVVAGRLRHPDAERPGALRRFAIAAAAACGALLTIALIALPARGAAVRSEAATPQAVAAGYALIGIVLGLVVAYWAVVSRPVAANLVTTAVWLWLLAAAAVVADLVAGRPSATFLNSWQFAELDGALRYGTIYWPSALLTLLVAFLIGALAAWPAARRGELGLGTAVSGAVGPLLVGAAFFALAPQLTRSMGPLESAYLIAPYGVLAGLAGSALAVSAGRSAERRRDRSAPARPDSADTADSALAGATAAQLRSDGGAAESREAPEPSGAGTAPPPDATAAPRDPSGATRAAHREPSGATGESAGATAVRPGPSSMTTARPESTSSAGATAVAPPADTITPPDAPSPRPDAAAPRADTAAPRAPRGRKAPAQRSTPAAAEPVTERRSTVSAPPPSPPVARINPPPAGPPSASAPAKKPTRRDPDVS